MNILFLRPGHHHRGTKTIKGQVLVDLHHMYFDTFSLLQKLKFVQRYIDIFILTLSTFCDNCPNK